MKNPLITTIVTSLQFFSLSSIAAPAALTLQGRLAKDSLAVTGPVTVKVSVRSPNSALCLLYEETHSITLNAEDGGVFSVAIGGGSKTSNDKGLTMAEVFSNTGSAINGLVCPGPGAAVSYTPLTAHGRNVFLSFDTNVGTVAFNDPYVIQSVPYAIEAERLAGKPAASYLQTSLDTTQSKLEALMGTTPYAALLALINGTSTQYMTPGSAISTSGNFAQTGATTLSTGTGAVALNGATTVAANRNFALSSGTGTFAQTYTGTGTAQTLEANSVASTAAQSVTANGLTSGSILSLTSNSTGAAAGNKGLSIAISGVNANSSVSRTGVSSSVSSSGLTSTNVAGYFSATNGSKNHGLIVENGNVGIGTTDPGYRFVVEGAMRSEPNSGMEVLGGLAGIISSSMRLRYTSGVSAIEVPGSLYFDIDDDSNSGTEAIFFRTNNGGTTLMKVQEDGTVQMSGYTQLAVVSALPPGTDCDTTDEYGRMKVNATGGVLYICMASGWVAK